MIGICDIYYLPMLLMFIEYFTNNNSSTLSSSYSIVIDNRLTIICGSTIRVAFLSLDLTPNKDDDGQHLVNYNIFFFLQILEKFKITISLNVPYFPCRPFFAISNRW
jgi:hypothetical protein